MRVLVVEDEPPVSAVFEDFLREFGHEPLIAGTAEDALSLLRTEHPDVVLLDVRLPGMSGLDFLRIQTTREPAVPIVVISGVATEAQARECLRLGAFDFMGKPVQIDRLKAVLECLEPLTTAAETPDTAAGDRRRASRAALSLPVRVLEYDGVEWDGTSVNLSASGIKVRPADSVRPAPAAKLSFAMPDGGARLEVASVLVRADVDGYAFYFINTTAPQLYRLNALVNQFNASGHTQAEPHVDILRTIAEAVSRSLDVDDVLRVALDALTRVTGHEISSLHLLSSDGTTLRLHGDRGLRPRLREINRTIAVGQGLIGQVAATGRTLHVADVRTAPDLLPDAREVIEQEGIRGFVCVPIQSHGETLGTLSLGRRTADRFSDAEIALLEASAHQIGTAFDNARLYAETHRQLEDLKHAESQLAEGERLSTLGTLAAGLAHEINNPLTAILGQAEMLSTRPEPFTESQKRLQIIIRETSRAARLVRSLLELSRRRRPERRSCRLEEQTRFVLEVVSPQLRRDEIDVVTDLPPIPPVWADEDQIRQVVLNLVQNAHQALAGHAGERVLTVRAGASGRMARLEILDSGPGIPAEALPRIFDAFFTTKAPGHGTGLGLWVSSNVIEEHGGRLSAENRPEGGAAFSVELPFADREG